MKTISSWSFSRLTDFETCKYRAKLKYLDKVPEPERPLPPGKTEHAHDRGTRVHTAAELFVKGGVELAPELANYKDSFLELRAFHAASKGNVSLEGEWAFDHQWNTTAWSSYNAWCRMKLDAFVLFNETEGKVIDYKTGRKFGNEVKHAEQGQLYQLAAFLRNPTLASVSVEFWYLDQPVEQKSVFNYSRDQGTRYIEKFAKRGALLTSETEFPPNPNAYSCKWCPYLGNACIYGVSEKIIKAAQPVVVERKKRKGKKVTGMAALFNSNR